MNIKSVTPNAVADRFSAVLREWLTEDEMREVLERNLTPEYTGACATHDFCDANMAMGEALQSLGVDPFEGGEIGDAVTDLWNAAWDIARARGFRIGEAKETTWCECSEEDRIPEYYDFFDQGSGQRRQGLGCGRCGGTTLEAETVKVSYEVCSEVETHLFITEASTLGLKVGEWPEQIATVMGNSLPFERRGWNGEAMVYRQQYGCLILHVLND